MLRVSFIGYVRRVGGVEMNKREFNERMDKIIFDLDIYDGGLFTCILMTENFSNNMAYPIYDKFISKFLWASCFSLKYESDRFELRFYLLEQFRDHCLRTGIYKEF